MKFSIITTAGNDGPVRDVQVSEGPWEEVRCLSDILAAGAAYGDFLGDVYRARVVEVMATLEEEHPGLVDEVASCWGVDLDRYVAELREQQTTESRRSDERFV